MDGFEPIGRLLIVAGLVIAGLGVLIVVGPSIPLIGRLPGDIRIERENASIFIPIGTMVVVSVILTILFNLIGRGR
jgi:hypothetical protein